MTTEFMPEIKPEQRLWDSFVLSLEHIISNSGRNELSVDIADRFLKIMDEIEEQILEYGSYLGYASDDHHPGEVNLVLNKIVKQDLLDFHSKNPSIDLYAGCNIYNKTVWNLIQDLKRPVKKIVNSEHIFPEETKEFARFIDYAKRHAVSYSMEHIERL